VRNESCPQTRASAVPALGLTGQGAPCLRNSATSFNSSGAASARGVDRTTHIACQSARMRGIPTKNSRASGCAPDSPRRACNGTQSKTGPLQDRLNVLESEHAPIFVESTNLRNDCHHTAEHIANLEDVGSCHWPASEEAHVPIRIVRSPCDEATHLFDLNFDLVNSAFTNDNLSTSTCSTLADKRVTPTASTCTKDSVIDCSDESAGELVGHSVFLENEERGCVRNARTSFTSFGQARAKPNQPFIDMRASSH